MKRRKFLGFVGGAVAAPVVVKVAEALPAESVYEHKTLGTTIICDSSKITEQLGPIRSGGIITTGNHPKAMWPGVKEAWEKAFDISPPEPKDFFS